VFHDKSKYIDIKSHFIRDCVQRGSVRLPYVSIDQQVVGILAKALGKANFVFFRDKLGVVENTFLAKRKC